MWVRKNQIIEMILIYIFVQHMHRAPIAPYTFNSFVSSCSPVILTTVLEVAIKLNPSTEENHRPTR